MTEPIIRVELEDLKGAVASILPSLHNQRPLNVIDLCGLSNFDQVKKDFALLKNLAEGERTKRSQCIAARPDNKIKNRFINVHPCNLMSIF